MSTNVRTWAMGHPLTSVNVQLVPSVVAICPPFRGDPRCPSSNEHPDMGAFGERSARVATPSACYRSPKPPTLPEVIQRGCKRCSGQLEKWSPKSRLHQCNPRLHECRMLLVHLHQDTFWLAKVKRGRADGKNSVINCRKTVLHSALRAVCRAHQPATSYSCTHAAH